MSPAGDDRTQARLQEVLAQVSHRPLSTRLCVAAPAIVGVDAAAVSLIDDSEVRSLVAASDARAAAVEAVQLEVGQGPSLVAADTGAMYLVPDLGDCRDPALAMYARRTTAETDIRAVFGFPLAAGPAAIGALNLYRTEPGPLSAAAVTAAGTVAGFLASSLLAEHAGAVAGQRELEWLSEPPDSRACVHQATGALIVQLGIGPAEAFARLRAHAFGADRRLTDVARDVLDHRLFLDR